MRKFLFTLALALMLAFAGEAQAASNYPNYKVEVVAEGLETPWALALLPSGDMLVTELKGSLRYIRRGKLVKNPIAGVPKVLYAGQGGLMDVVLDPKFKRNRIIYLSYAAPVGDKNQTTVMKAKLQGARLTNKKIIFRANPLKKPPVHYGGRMAFMKDGTLLITLGDGFNLREEAQNPKTHFGSIVRINTDGSVPKDNPYVTNKKGKPEIWTIGHRNVQAILVDSKGRVFANEHGPQGGDEVNLIQKGKNYGWPVVTYGLDYSGATISPWKERKGYESPLHQWTPSIGPSSMAIYEARAFSKWRGSLFVTSLIFGRVERLTLKGDKVVAKENLFEELDDRLRYITVGKRGALYLLAETKGQVLKITPQ